jgi:hypothetical protein
LLFAERAANWSDVGLGKRGLSEKFTTTVKLESKHVVIWIIAYNIADTSPLHRIELPCLEVLARREF